MARTDFDLLGGWVEAGAPLDDPIAARVDRYEANAGRERGREMLPIVAAAVTPQTGAAHEPVESCGTEHANGVDRPADERVNRELVLERRTERDNAGHQLRSAYCQHAREAAAAALTNDRDLLAAVLGEALEAALEAFGRPLRAIHVGGDPGTTRAVARLLEPACHQVQRLVACEEPRHEQDRLVVTGRDGLAAPDRRAHQRRQLEADPTLPPQGRNIGVS